MTRPSAPLSPPPHARKHEDDRLLFDAWLRGDPHAPAALIARHYDSLMRFFANRVGKRDAEDLTQATVLACLECRPRVRGEASFRGLLFAIARNMIKRHRYALRRAARRVERELLPSSPPLPSTALLHEDEIARLHEALARLPEEHRAMLEAYYWDCVMLKDIAATQGARLNTVKGQISRVRQRLAKELE